MPNAVRAPLYITMHALDNVAIVANDGGLPAGTVFASGLTLVDQVPQGHKAARAIAKGSWVHERLLELPVARSLDGLPVATMRGAAMPPLEGHTFEGYRN